MQSVNQTEPFKQAFDKAAALCSRYEKCISEVRSKLFDWQIDESLYEPIIEQLIEERYLDEARYTKGFITDKIRFGKWGRIKIRYMLRGKGIASDLVEAAFADIDEELYHEMVFSELDKKKKKLKGTSFEIQGKLYRFGASRGFESDLIIQFLKNE